MRATFSPSSSRMRPVPRTMSETFQPVRPKRRWACTVAPFHSGFQTGSVFTIVSSLMCFPMSAQPRPPCPTPSSPRAAATAAAMTIEPRATPAPLPAPARKLRRSGSTPAARPRTAARTTKNAMAPMARTDPNRSTTPDIAWWHRARTAARRSGAPSRRRTRTGPGRWGPCRGSALRRSIRRRQREEQTSEDGVAGLGKHSAPPSNPQRMGANRAPAHYTRSAPPRAEGISPGLRSDLGRPKVATGSQRGRGRIV